MNTEPTAPIPAAPKSDKAVLLNALALLVAEVITELPTIQDQLPPDYYLFAFYALGAANIALKFLTGKPIKIGSFKRP